MTEHLLQVLTSWSISVVLLFLAGWIAASEDAPRLRMWMARLTLAFPLTIALAPLILIGVALYGMARGARALWAVAFPKPEPLPPPGIVPSGHCANCFSELAADQTQRGALVCWNSSCPMYRAVVPETLTRPETPV